MTFPCKWHFHFHDISILVTFPFLWHFHFCDVPIVLTFPFLWHSVYSVSISISLRWYRTINFQSASQWVNECVMIIRTRDTCASKKDCILDNWLTGNGLKWLVMAENGLIGYGFSSLVPCFNCWLWLCVS